MTNLAAACGGLMGEIDMDVQIRWMIRRDMPEVLGIEARSFQDPWTEDDFLMCLRQPNCIGMVAENAEKAGREIVGFMIYELLPKKLHVLNFAVDTPCRRQTVGSQMADKLKHKLSQHRRTQIDLEIRDGNLEAQLFFKRHGFRCVGVWKNYFEPSGEDAYRFRYSIVDAPHTNVWHETNRISGFLEDATA